MRQHQDLEFGLAPNHALNVIEYRILFHIAKTNKKPKQIFHEGVSRHRGGGGPRNEMLEERATGET